MNRKQFAVNMFFALILLSVALMPLSVQQTSTYDPWLDYDEDGKIDVNDLHPLGQSYGSTGDPTKNVNVTNWPVERELFPENLILRAAYYSGGSGAAAIKRDLFDSTSMHPYFPLLYDDSTYTVTLTTTSTLIYNNTYIYQKIPTSAYQILGMPAVLLTWNATNSVSVTYNTEIHVYLGKISTSEQWTQLADLGYQAAWLTGKFTNFQWTRWFSPATPVNTRTDAYERLAIRIMIYGYTLSGTTDLIVDLIPDPDTDHFMADIPIVSNPPYTP